MGLTHHWHYRKHLPKRRLVEAVRDVKTVAEVLQQRGVALAGPSGKGDPVFAVVGKVGVAFNGDGENAHESFIFPDFPEQAGFCKTARKPYDLAVTAALIILKHHLRESLTIGSDEATAHFRPAMNLCQEILGYGEEFRLDWTLRGAGDLLEYPL